MSEGHVILVVEDTEMVQKLLCKVLEAQGYRVVVAADADEAITLLVDGLRPELVLVDYGLPGSTGAKLIKSMRKFMDLAQMPVVGMSCSHKEAEGEFRALDVPYLEKPFRMADLLEYVKKAISKA
jgi:DNA-binding response OmpR family regulator